MANHQQSNQANRVTAYGTGPWLNAFDYLWKWSKRNELKTKLD